MSTIDEFKTLSKYCEVESNQKFPFKNISLKTILNFFKTPLISSEKHILLKLDFCSILDPVFKPEQLDKKIEWITKDISIDYNTNNFQSKITSFKNSFKSNDNLDLDYDWILKQNECLKTLNRKELYALRAYTEKGYDIINEHLFPVMIYNRSLVEQYKLAKSSYFPLFFIFYNKIKETSTDKIDEGYISSDLKCISIIKKIKNNTFSYEKIYNLLIPVYPEVEQKFWCNIIDDYISLLNTIILTKTIPTTKSLTLYRGEKTIYSSIHNNMLYSNMFSSTSLLLSEAYKFSNPDKKCCIKIISVPVNKRVLFLTPISMQKNELEILLGSYSVFEIKDSLEKYNYYKFDNDLITSDYKEICKLGSPMKTIYLTFKTYNENYEFEYD
jgi:hypothetical protein